MSNALNIAQTGLDAASLIFSAAASEPVNRDQPGQNPLAVQLTDVPEADGVAGLLVLDTEANPALPPPTPSDASLAATDSVAAAENLRKAQVLYAANAIVIDTQQNTFGNLIDMLDNSQSQAPDEDSDSVL